jgi:APA family basic amino acid/polyamine antiporter
MAEEAKEAATTIPAAIRRVVIAVFVIYAALPAVALSALPVTQQPDGSYSTPLGEPEEEGGFAGDPILGIVKSIDLGPLQDVAEIYVGLLAATILLIATNAGILGVSRLVYSMGIHRQLPDRLRQLHPKFRTPWIGILLFAAIACIAVIPGQAEFLGNMYAFGAMLSFTIAHVAVIRLRRKFPDHERPYRGPGRLRIRGYDLPLFAVLGGLGTLIAFLTVTFLHIDVAIAGIGWLAIGVVIYVLFRRRIGLDLTTTTKVALPHPVVEREAEYESVLVAFDERGFVAEVFNTAQRMAARRRRGIHVVVTIDVPRTVPIDAELPDQELAAQEIIEQAKVQGGRRVSGHWEKVRPGGAGRRLVDAARQTQARAVVIPMSGGGSFGRTLETLLTERPCRVIVESVPGNGAGGGAANRTPAGR